MDFNGFNDFMRRKRDRPRGEIFLKVISLSFRDSFLSDPSVFMSQIISFLLATINSSAHKRKKLFRGGEILDCSRTFVDS